MRRSLVDETIHRLSSRSGIAHKTLWSDSQSASISGGAYTREDIDLVQTIFDS
jgi:hypothetical protein